ncbi:MAG TPA: ABC transporter permease [Candidatus Binatia bacterium]|nr:ABC transporter permease [Candidatus Binatia bacterium]
MSSLLHDLRYAFRQLRKNPGFTSVTVLTLALGIGVNAAMFAVIDAVLLRPLPFPKPDQIVQVSEATPQDVAASSSSVPDIRDWRAQSHSFQDIGYYTVSLRGVDVPGFSDFIPVVLGSANLLTTLQVEPALGRGFLANEDQPGHGDVVLINSVAWEKFFNRSPKAVGSSLKMGDRIFTVIGVMPAGFEFPYVGDGPAVWGPLVLSKEYEGRDSRAVVAEGRLKTGVSLSAAQSELSGIQGNISKAYPTLELSKRVLVTSYRQVLTGNVRSALLALQFAVLAVWLIACANVASLLLSRTTGRRREIAIRSAIGADHSRLVRQFLTESQVLAFSGAALGLALAFGCVRALKFYLDLYLPLSSHIHIDARVAAALIAFSIVSAVLFGLVPAIQAARAPAQQALREGTPSAGASRWQKHLRDALVVGEIALSLLLLVSAGLLLRSLLALHQLPLGFVPHNAVTASIFLPQANGALVGNSGKYAGKNIAQVFYTPLLDRLTHLPGVESAALTSILPLSPQSQIGGSFDIVGRPSDPENKTTAAVRAVSPNLYSTLGIRLLRGRLFTDSDGPQGQGGAVVNQAFVSRYFRNQNPLGQQLKISDKGPHGTVTIIGVVEDVHQTAMTDTVQPEIDLSYLQLAPDDELTPYALASFSNFVLRTHVDPVSVIPAVRSTLRDFDPDLLVTDVRTMQEIVDTSLGSQTLAVRLLWIFAGAALLISIAGIYGLLAYNVSQRTRDLGVRMALGATRSSVIALVLRHALVLLATGVAIGVLAAVSAGNVLRSFLYGVVPYDAFTIFAVSLLLLACGLFASYIPARRASRIDPVKALRWE